MIPYEETMLRLLPDRQEVASVAGTTGSANIKDFTDREIKRMHQHKY
jgi:hypothetical protein